jgi:endonuclease YncB( thermonuclease family)
MIGLAIAIAIACVASVHDGDSLRLCDGERIRLLAVDAPELGPCRPGRICAPGDPIASRDNLRHLIGNGPIEVERVGQDRYGRTLAVVNARGVNLSCAQIRGGFAIYRKDWDNSLRIGRSCR